MNRMLYTIEDMSPSQHFLAQLHEFRHTMFPISNIFLKLEGDQGDSFGPIEFEAPSKPFLGKEPEVR